MAFILFCLLFWCCQCLMFNNMMYHVYWERVQSLCICLYRICLAIFEIIVLFLLFFLHQLSLSKPDLGTCVEIYWHYLWCMTLYKRECTHAMTVTLCWLVQLTSSRSLSENSDTTPVLGSLIPFVLSSIKVIPVQSSVMTWVATYLISLYHSGSYFPVICSLVRNALRAAVRHLRRPVINWYGVQ